jgi:hypothetical protein
MAWDNTRLRVYPPSSNPSLVAPQRTAIVMSWSDTRVGCLSRWKTVLIGHCLEPSWILCSRLAKAATGHRWPPMASWCTTAFFVPFMVLAMQIVALWTIHCSSDPPEISFAMSYCGHYPLPRFIHVAMMLVYGIWIPSGSIIVHNTTNKVTITSCAQ